MFVEKEWVEEYKKWWLSQGHTLTSTLMYVSVIRRYVGDKGIELNQKTVDKFRENHMNTVSSGALKSFFRFLVRKKQFDDDILNIRFQIHANPIILLFLPKNHLSLVPPGLFHMSPRCLFFQLATWAHLLLSLMSII